MKTRGASLAALMLLASQVASGQEDWRGPYVGGIVGHSLQPDDDDERIEFDANLDGAFGEVVNSAAPANFFSPGFCGGRNEGLSPGECPDDEGAADFGLRAGYDWQFGTWVVGAVADVSFSDVDDSTSAFSITPARYTMTRELNWLIGARVRGGYILPNNLLVYGTGGLAWADLDHVLETTDPDNTFAERGDDRLMGLQLGVGVEWSVGTNWRIAGEYLYTNLDDDDYRVRANGGPFGLVNANGTDFRRSEDRFNVNGFRATFTYRFNGF